MSCPLDWKNVAGCFTNSLDVLGISKIGHSLCETTAIIVEVVNAALRDLRDCFCLNCGDVTATDANRAKVKEFKEFPKANFLVEAGAVTQTASTEHHFEDVIITDEDRAKAKGSPMPKFLYETADVQESPVPKSTEERSPPLEMLKEPITKIGRKNLHFAAAAALVGVVSLLTILNLTVLLSIAKDN